MKPERENEMDLVDIKRPKKTEKEIKKEQTIGYPMNEERYPYGTCLTFEKEEIEKIDVLKEIKAAETVEISAIGFVKEVAITDTSEKSGERKRHRVEIQIQKIGFSIKKNKKLEDMDAVEYRKARSKG